MMTRYAMQEPQRYKIRITDRPAQPHKLQHKTVNANTSPSGTSLGSPCLIVQPLQVAKAHVALMSGVTSPFCLKASGKLEAHLQRACGPALS